MDGHVEELLTEFIRIDLFDRSQFMADDPFVDLYINIITHE